MIGIKTGCLCFTNSTESIEGEQHEENKRKTHPPK